VVIRFKSQGRTQDWHRIAVQKRSSLRHQGHLQPFSYRIKFKKRSIKWLNWISLLRQIPIIISYLRLMRRMKQLSKLGSSKLSMIIVFNLAFLLPQTSKNKSSSIHQKNKSVHRSHHLVWIKFTITEKLNL